MLLLVCVRGPWSLVVTWGVVEHGGCHKRRWLWCGEVVLVELQGRGLQQAQPVEEDHERVGGQQLPARLQPAHQRLQRLAGRQRQLACQSRATHSPAQHQAMTGQTALSSLSALALCGELVLHAGQGGVVSWAQLMQGQQRHQTTALLRRRQLQVPARPSHACQSEAEVLGES